MYFNFVASTSNIYLTYLFVRVTPGLRAPMESLFFEQSLYELDGISIPQATANVGNLYELNQNVYVDYSVISTRVLSGVL